MDKNYTFSMEPVADVKIGIGILQSTLTKDHAIPFSVEGPMAGGKIKAVAHTGVHASMLPKEERVVTSSVTVVLLSDGASMDPIPSSWLWCSVLTLKDLDLRWY